MTIIFLVNLIVGVGSLTLPLDVQGTGLALGSLIFLVFAFAAFMTATFVIELLSLGNHIRNKSYLISEPIPLSELGRLWLPTVAERWFLNFCLIAYLYGDLAIYASAVPVSLVRVFDEDSPPYIYRLFVVVFGLLIVPFCFFPVHSTKAFQLITGAARQAALWLMITLAFLWFAQGNGVPSVAPVLAVKVSGLRSLLGASAYCFMCHHSLPSLIAPLNEKRRAQRIVAITFVFIFFLYSLLVWSTNLAFGDERREECPDLNHRSGSRFVTCQVQQLITLNYESFSIVPIATFLSLYMVISLPFNFVIISVTLKQTLASLLPSRVRPSLITLIVTIPPLLLAFFTEDVKDIVSVTGLGGIFIIFFFPARLIALARADEQYRRRSQELRLLENSTEMNNSAGHGDDDENISLIQRSPFRSVLWRVFIFLLGTASLFVVVSENLLSFFNNKS